MWRAQPSEQHTVGQRHQHTDTTVATSRWTRDHRLRRRRPREHPLLGRMRREVSHLQTEGHQNWYSSDFKIGTYFTAKQSQNLFHQTARFPYTIAILMKSRVHLTPSESLLKGKSRFPVPVQKEWAGWTDTSVGSPRVSAKPGPDFTAGNPSAPAARKGETIIYGKQDRAALEPWVWWRAVLKACCASGCLGWNPSSCASASCSVKWEKQDTCPCRVDAWVWSDESVLPCQQRRMSQASAIPALQMWVSESRKSKRQWLSCLQLLTILWTVACQAPQSVEFSPGKNTRVVCHFFLQGIFPAPGSNPGLPHCRWILYYLSHREETKKQKHLWCGSYQMAATACDEDWGIRTWKVKLQDAGPKQLRGVRKEWFRWAQTLASSHTWKSAKCLDLRYLALL